MTKPFFLFFIFLISLHCHGQDENKSKFSPGFSLGLNTINAHIDSDYDNGNTYIYGLEAGYNFNLTRSKRFCLSFEPVGSIGIITNFRGTKPNRAAYSGDANLIARYSFNKLMIGAGWGAGITKIERSNTYYGISGPALRFGVSFSPKLLIELKLSVQMGPYFMENRTITGLALVFK